MGTLAWTHVFCAVCQAMSCVATDIGLLHSSLPELSLKDWASAATEQAVRGHVSSAFGALEQRIHRAVKMINKQLSDAAGQSGRLLSSHPVAVCSAEHVYCWHTTVSTISLIQIKASGLHAVKQGSTVMVGLHRCCSCVLHVRGSCLHLVITPCGTSHDS